MRARKVGLVPWGGSGAGEHLLRRLSSRVGLAVKGWATALAV